MRGRLRGPTGPFPNPPLPPIDEMAIHNYWEHPLHGLAGAAPIGGPNGVAPLTPAERFMGAFGSKAWPEPLIPTDKQINGPKGKLWRLDDPIAIPEITRQAQDAVRADTPATADALLQSVRIVSLAPRWGIYRLPSWT